MTGLDLIVLVVVAVAAIGGFIRGLVQEVLSLAAWVLAAFSVYYLHGLLTDALTDFYDAEPTTPILAFALLLLIPYAAMKVIANTASNPSSGAVQGPIDRVLGFGFGALKGAVIVVFAFSVFALGFDESWSLEGRPDWIKQARSYQAIDAASRQLVPLIDERRSRVSDEASSD